MQCFVLHNAMLIALVVSALLWSAHADTAPSGARTCSAFHPDANRRLSGSQRWDVVTLTDDNFDQQLAAHSTEPWFIAIGAPWCPHCRELEPTWQTLAARLKGDVHVAKIDGNSERVLLQRFGVEVFPSLFFIRGVETRPCHDRSLDKLVEFATFGWRQVDPLPQNKSPTSQYGRAVGMLRMLPYRAGKLFQQLHDMGYSQLTILTGMLAIPVTLGLLFICALDSYYTRLAIRSAAPAGAGFARQ